MIYEIDKPLRYLHVQSASDLVSVVYTMAGEVYWLQILSSIEPRLIIEEQAGLLVETQPLGLSIVWQTVDEEAARQAAADPHEPLQVEFDREDEDGVFALVTRTEVPYYDRVGVPSPTNDGWLLKLQSPGPGEYNLVIEGQLPWHDTPSRFPLQVRAASIVAADQPELQSAFGTHCDFPREDGGDDNILSYEWFAGQPEYRQALEAGGSERDGWVAVYQGVNRDIREIGHMGAYQSQLLLWHAGEGVPQIGSDFFTCEDGPFGYPELGEAEMRHFNCDFGFTGGKHLFVDQPGVWALCGMRQDRVAVAGDPEQSAANLERWTALQIAYFSCQMAYGKDKGFKLLGYADEPGPYWGCEEGWERLKWTLDAALEAGYPFSATLPGPNTWAHLLLYDLRISVAIPRHDIDQEWWDDEMRAQLPSVESVWAYLVWDDSVMVNLVDGHTLHPGTGRGTASNTLKRIWLGNFDGLLFWSIIAPEYEGNNRWNDINHWRDRDGHWSLRLHRMGLGMGVWKWLEATAAALGSSGRFLLEGYIEGLETGPDLRALLWDLSEEFTPPAEYDMISCSDDLVGEIRVEWEPHPSGEYILWQTQDIDLSKPEDEITGWLPGGRHIVGQSVYFDQTPNGGESWRYRIDYWDGTYDGDRKHYVRMATDVVGYAMRQPEGTLEEKLIAAAQAAVEEYGVRINPGAAIAERIKELGHWPQHNESGDERIPDVVDGEDTYRFVRSQHPDGGRPVIIYAKVGEWDTLYELPYEPTQEA